jgi:hypothetical protein
MTLLATLALVQTLKPFVVWLVRHGFTDGAWRAVVVFVMLSVWHTLFTFTFWITDPGAMRTTGKRLLRTWMLFVAWLACATVWWILVPKTLNLAFPNLSLAVFAVIEVVLLGAGLSGLFFLADRVGRRLNVNIWGVKRGAA